jgi:signal peptidase I
MELAGLMVVAVVLASLAKAFLLQPFYIPSESMEPTLHGCATCQGDRILVNKLIYHTRAVHSGDIVVFAAPATWNVEGAATRPPANPLSWLAAQLGGPGSADTYLIKRVIATGGQTVRCCDARGRIEVLAAGSSSWQPLTEPYVANPLPLATGDIGGRAFPPIRVPTGRLWVMGVDFRSLARAQAA